MAHHTHAERFTIDVGQDRAMGGETQPVAALIGAFAAEGEWVLRGNITSRNRVCCAAITAISITAAAVAACTKPKNEAAEKNAF